MSDDGMSVASARRLGGYIPQDGAGESRRKACLLNDAFSALRLWGRVTAYPTSKADTVAIQFFYNGTLVWVDVDAVKFAAFCHEHCTQGAIIKALRRKYELSTTNTTKTNEQQNRQ